MGPKADPVKKPRRGARLLRRFIEAHCKEWSYRSLSKAIGVSHISLWKWAHADLVPKSDEHRIKLEEITRGAVPEASWLSEAEIAAHAARTARLVVASGER